MVQQGHAGFAISGIEGEGSVDFDLHGSGIQLQGPVLLEGRGNGQRVVRRLLKQGNLAGLDSLQDLPLEVAVKRDVDEFAGEIEAPVG